MSRRRSKRRGMITLDAALFLFSVFVVAVLLYWLAQASYVGLFTIISGHVGSPYM